MCGDCNGVMKARTIVVIALVVVGSAACGGDDPTAGLSAEAARGYELAQVKGCAACHGATGQGGVGPAWRGLFGTDVELESGDVVIADDAYLRQSIVDPDAQVVAGYTIAMPAVDLAADEVEALVAFIQELD